MPPAPRPPCPHLPPAVPGLDWRALAAHRGGDPAALYETAITYAQGLWLSGLSARAILALDRALFADLRGDEPVLRRLAPPYSALGWIVRNHPGDSFLGNPRVSFQHLADRVRGPRAAVLSWRAWAAWAVVRAHRPDLPGDPAHAVREPDLAEIAAALSARGWPGETEAWKAALEGGTRAGQG